VSDPVTKSSTPPNTKLIAAVAYFGGLITGAVILVVEKHDRFVRFHAMQSILFCAAAIVFSIAWNIVWGILFSISGSLIFIDVPLRLAISLGLFLFWLFAGVSDSRHRCHCCKASRLVSVPSTTLQLFVREEHSYGATKKSSDVEVGLCGAHQGGNCHRSDTVVCVQFQTQLQIIGGENG
jgi:uncharacterized membrane protein